MSTPIVHENAAQYKILPPLTDTEQLALSHLMATYTGPRPRIGEPGPSVYQTLVEQHFRPALAGTRWTETLAGFRVPVPVPDPAPDFLAAAAALGLPHYHVTPDGLHVVPSASVPGVTYDVNLAAGTCTCPSLGDCWHLRYATAKAAAAPAVVAVQWDSAPAAPAAHPCKDCGAALTTSAYRCLACVQRLLAPLPIGRTLGLPTVQDRAAAARRDLFGPQAA